MYISVSLCGYTHQYMCYSTNPIHGIRTYMTT